MANVNGSPDSTRPLPLHTVDASTCHELEDSSSLEWLLSNGVGGYAMGTVAGVATRRYHGLLVAPCRDQVRRLLLDRVEEVVTTGSDTYELSCNHWTDGATAPEGYLQLESFSLHGRTPTWTWKLGEHRFSRTLSMVHGHNAVVIRYEHLEGPGSLQLECSILMNARDHHELTPDEPARAKLEQVPDGFVARLSPTSGPGEAVQVHVAVQADRLRFTDDIYGNIELPVEKRRGYDHVDAARRVAVAGFDLVPGSACSIVASVAPTPELPPARQLVDDELARQANLLEAMPVGEERVDRLCLAADQFLVQRMVQDTPMDTIIAGYPWFMDWGRDTMLSIPGLLLGRGLVQPARRIILGFASMEKDGLIPNRFPDAGGEPEYNTADASLLMGVTVGMIHARWPDQGFAERIWPTLQAIYRAHEQGTCFGIQLDERDGLLRAGTEGVQLTWMDARVGDRVITPRIGKPIEINAFWYDMIRTIIEIGKAIGEPVEEFRIRADSIEESFERFWNPDQQCCKDVLDGPSGDDDSVRPNQLLAIDRHGQLIDDERGRLILSRCRELLVPLGVRTLDPKDPDYVGHYAGDVESRDAAYHQGTAWPWLVGPFMRAVRRIAPDPQLEDLMLQQVDAHLDVAGLGSISEVLDGDDPWQAGGCPAQAWSVGQVLELLVQRPG